MRLLFLTLLTLVAFGLAACGGSSAGEAPTLVPTAHSGLAAPGGDLSPRATPDSGLPPTWTPEPSPERPTIEPTLVSADAPEGEESYTVQAGDTLAEIAERFNVALNDLARANDIIDINLIEVGQVLVIPR
jgi:LysM repeat protein